MYAIRGPSDGFDEVLAFTSWVQDIAGSALRATPGPAGVDACVFAAAVMARLGHLRETPHALDLHRAVNLGDTATAQAIKSAIRQHNLRGLPLPEHLREYLARCEETGTDYTRRPRGGDPWRHAARDRALARAAYDWRLTRPAHDWRTYRPDLAAPAACLRWTANALTDTLDCIADPFGTWPAEPPADLSFFPSAELCAAHGLPANDDQDALLHRIYPQHFRGLLIGHAAALCLDEWARRIAAGPDPT